MSSAVELRKGSISSSPLGLAKARKAGEHSSLDKLVSSRPDPVEELKQKALWSRAYYKQKGRRPCQWCREIREKYIPNEEEDIDGSQGEELVLRSESGIEAESEVESMTSPGSVEEGNQLVNTEDILQDLSGLFLDGSPRHKGLCRDSCSTGEDAGPRSQIKDGPVVCKMGYAGNVRVKEREAGGSFEEEGHEQSNNQGEDREHCDAIEPISVLTPEEWNLVNRIFDKGEIKKGPKKNHNVKNKGLKKVSRELQRLETTVNYDVVKCKDRSVSDTK